MNNADAYLILNLLPGIGPVRVNQLLTLFGDPVSILTAKPAELARVPGIGEHFANLLSRWNEHCDPERERQMAVRGDVSIVTRDDEDYPALLREIHDPPLCLYVRGARQVMRDSRHALAVVGSRRTTEYGIRMTENLAGSAALAGWTVVSGLARGIDTVAHEATLRVHGRTIAVLGSGLAQIYPQENIDLARRIAEQGGALVSEFPMFYHPDKTTFPMRNRVISGMTLGCVVVEAGARSGSLITATQALDQNRQVFAVPGRVDSPQSRGCHALIKEGAKLVESFADVLEEFAGLPGLQIPAPLAAADSAKPGDLRAADLHLTDLESKILAFLASSEVAIDDVVVGVNEPASKVLGALVALELRHLVRQLPGRRVTRCRDMIPG